MRTAVISDLHLGTRSRVDVLRARAPRERLLAAVAGFDQLVLLGDVVELRDRPLGEAIDDAAAFLEELGAALVGGRVVIVPGNHDHRLAHEALDLGRRRRGGHLALSVEVRAGATGAVGAIRRALGTELMIAYPGIALSEGIWATHGHYLDAHSSAPTFECAAAALAGALRRRPPGSLRRPADYEAVLAPAYGLYFAIAQRRRLRSGADAGRRLVRLIETRLGTRGPSPGDRSDRARSPVALGGGRAGTAPGELRRPGLLPFACVLDGLGVEADHVLFGHTHRTGPLAGDDPRPWRTAAGTALWNTGSWVYEPAFVDGGGDTASPYWPGTVTTIEGSGALRIRRLLEDLAPESLSGR